MPGATLRHCSGQCSMPRAAPRRMKTSLRGPLCGRKQSPPSEGIALLRTSQRQTPPLAMTRPGLFSGQALLGMYLSKG